MKLCDPMLAVKADVRRLIPFCEDDSYGGQQKIDGDRLLVHVDDGVVRTISRNGLHLSGVGTLIPEQFASMEGRWVFDGEYLDKTYFVFDILAGGGRDFAEDSLLERYRTLTNFYGLWDPDDCVRLLPMAFTHAEKCDLASHVMSDGLEGLVFKHLESRYRAGKKHEQWWKIKFRNEVDAVVMELGRYGHNNMVVGVYKDGVLTEIGDCTAGAGDGALVQVGDVVCITYQYMSPKKQRLIQPTLPKIRLDKPATDCTWDQLVWENKTVRI